MLYATGFGHGDAIHLAKLDPQRPGLEVFDVHEERGTYAWDVHDAATGEILLKGGPAGIDNGRGMAAQIDSRQHAYSFWSAGDPTVRSAADGSEQDDARLPINFRIYWDGDAQDELLDGVNIRKWEKGHTSMLGIFGTINKPDPETAEWGDRPWRREPMHRGSEADDRRKPAAQTNDRRKAVKTNRDSSASAASSGRRYPLPATAPHIEQLDQEQPLSAGRSLRRLARGGYLSRRRRPHGRLYLYLADSHRFTLSHTHERPYLPNGHRLAERGLQPAATRGRVPSRRNAEIQQMNKYLFLL